MGPVEDFRQSIVRMCLNLVGQTVTINWQKPVVIAAHGQAYLNHRGVIAFDIDPEMSQETTYRVAIHESVHCIAGHINNLPSRPAQFELLHHQTGPFVEKTEKEWEEYRDDPQEVEVEKIAKVLEQLAVNNALRMFGNDDLRNRISVLSQIRILRPEKTS
jgi:hypothetical protein